MLGQIVEISNPGQRLILTRGFLEVRTEEGVAGKVPLDDIEAIIAATPALTYSNQLLAALAERGAPVVICSRRFAPIAMLLPLSGHHAQGERFEVQARAKRPLKKRAWAQLVRAKIRAQAAVLEVVGNETKRLKRLADNVRSGDSENVEAQAAQYYWPRLFGKTFRRDRKADGINTLLNYGYTVLRAATARSVVGAGLHPSLGLHHKSGGDALRLADDLMEPFRPTVDLFVWEIVGDQRDPELTIERKRRLAGVLHADFSTDHGASPLSNVLSQLARSLADLYLGRSRKLVLPVAPLPLLEDENLADGGPAGL